MKRVRIGSLQPIASLMLGGLLSMCTPTTQTPDDGSVPTDAGRLADAGRANDATVHGDAFVPADAAIVVDAYAADAYVPPPCTPATSGMPGQLLCTGIRYAGDGSMVEASAVVMNGGVTNDTGVFLADGDVYVQVPLMLDPNCSGAGQPPVLSAPRTGSFMVEVTVDGTVTPLTLDITDLALDDTAAGVETLIWIDSLHDMLSTSTDPDTLALADTLGLTSAGITSALSAPITLFSIPGYGGCIPAYSCCPNAAVLDRYGITVVDAYLRNIRRSMIEIGPHVLDDPPLDSRLANCDANWQAAALCSLGGVGVAAIEVLDGRLGDAVVASLGAVVYAITAIDLGVQAILRDPLGIPRWVGHEVTQTLGAINSGVHNVIMRAFTMGTDAACSALRRLWRRTVDDATVDCSACAVQQNGECANSCYGDPTACGCGAAQLACANFVSYYCAAYSCTGECIDRLCTYAGSVLEDDDGSPHACPSRCSGSACSSIGF